jgi:hypothetical protein
MPHKHPNTERIGGPGASHENRKHPEKTMRQNEHPTQSHPAKHSKISGGGGEKDAHHTHSPPLKGGK